MGIPGLSPLPHQHSDRGGEEKGGGTTRLCPYDAEDVGYKGRCDIWTVMLPAQDHFTSSLQLDQFCSRLCYLSMKFSGVPYLKSKFSASLTQNNLIVL